MPQIQPDSRYSWYVAAATLILASVSFGAANSVPILFPEISHEFGWDAELLASLYAVTMFGAALSSLLMGRLLDKIGFFPIGLIATILVCLGIILASLGTEIWHFYVIYAVFIGIGQGAFLSTIAAAVSQWFIRNRSLAIAIALCGQGVGGLFVPPVLRAVSTEIGWRDALLNYSLFSFIVMTIAVMFYLPKPPVVGMLPKKTVLIQQKTRKSATSNSLIVWLALGLFLANSGSMGVASYLVAYGASAGLSAVSAGSLMSVLWGLVLISRLIVGYTLDRLDKYVVLVSATCFQIFGTVLILVSDSVLMVALGAAFIGIGFGGYFPAYGALVQSNYPKDQIGRRMTELYLASFIAAGFGTWLVGKLFDMSDGSFSLGFFAAFLLSLAALTVVLACKGHILKKSTHCN